MKTIQFVTIILLIFLTVTISLTLIIGPDNIINDLDDYKISVTEYDDIKTVQIIGLNANQSDIYHDVSNFKHICPHSDIADHHFAFTSNNAEYITIQSGLVYDYNLQDGTATIIFKDYFYKDGWFTYGGF